MAETRTGGHAPLPRSRWICAPLLVLVALGWLLMSACGQPDAQIINTPVLGISGKAGSFDNIEINQADHRLYVADRTDIGVDVFDISKAHAKYLGTIALPSSPNGLAVAPGHARLYVGTAAGSVEVIDINPNSPALETVIAEVPTGGKSADLLDYGAARNRLYVSNGAEGMITSIDLDTNAIRAHFNVGYPLEQPRFDPADGMVYVTSPTADSLFQIDPNDGLVKNTFALGGCYPTGMAIDTTSNSALIACKNFVLSWNLRSRQSQKFTQVAGGDVVNYAAKVDQFFVGAPHQGVVGVFGGNPIAFVSAVATVGRGNAAVYDEANDLVYSPDTRIKKAGIAGFHVPATPPPWLAPLTTLGVVVVLLGVFGMLFYFIGRSADPVRRREVAPKPAAQ